MPVISSCYDVHLLYQGENGQTTVYKPRLSIESSVSSSIHSHHHHHHQPRALLGAEFPILLSIHYPSIVYCFLPPVFTNVSMRSVLTLATLSVGASALVPHIGPRNDSPDGEWFTLTANGPPTKLGSTHGAIGQLGDGQNRIGDGYPKGEYRIKDGKVWDKHGRGCILTPPTTQWQCDEGAIRESPDLLLPLPLDNACITR